ncbi:uncharacterized protein LOC122810566 [Protopterus annectens]|uniref:uncharacterized protein LOC122810566 n=1 Tax=Protopterus annectens TaxID=7888 RepID=UPI001CFC148D|nr:uncharacterized protein LOC122810566 [Protopterus annectens]
MIHAITCLLSSLAESYSGSTDNTSCETTLAGNIAFNGIASGSSKYSNGDPNNAIDGCKATNFSFNSCSHTRNDSASWWMLDLKADFNICAVAVTNRGDCCPQRIIGSQIHIGNFQENNGILNPSCGTISSLSAGATIMFDCSVMEGQFITINIPGRAEYLTLCEVQVLQCPPLTSGQTLDVVFSPGNNVNQANCSVEQSTFEQTTEHTTQPMTTATQNITTTQKTVSIQNIITAQNTTTQNIIATQDTITTEVDIKLSTSESTGWSNLVTKGNFFEVHLIKEKRTWKQALLYCHNSYGCLVTVTSDDIQKAVEAIVNNASTSGVWIGLHKHWLQDQWMWTNGEPYKYNKWNKGEPNNPATERCGMIVMVNTRGDDGDLDLQIKETEWQLRLTARVKPGINDSISISTKSMAEVLPALTDIDQCGFVEGMQTYENINRTITVQRESECEKILVSEKARAQQSRSDQRASDSDYDRPPLSAKAVIAEVQAASASRHFFAQPQTWRSKNDGLSYSFCKREIKQYFTVRNAKMLALESDSGSTVNPFCAVPARANIALNGNASQSSTYDNYEPIKANDGCINANFSLQSCAHTDNNYNPWWMLDLKAYFNICAVAVTNRGDCCPERINGAQIHIGNCSENNGTFNPSCGTISSLSAGATIMFDCSVMEGQFITINIPGRAEYLTLCEVQVLQCPSLISGQPLSTGNNANQASHPVVQLTSVETTKYTTQQMTTATKNIVTTGEHTKSTTKAMTTIMHTMERQTAKATTQAVQVTTAAEMTMQRKTGTAQQTESTEWNNSVTKEKSFGLHLIKENKTWKQALVHCCDKNRCLVSVASDDIQKAVEAIVNNASTSGVWIGLHKHWLQDQWMWTNGEPYKYNKWNKGEPSSPATERCGMMYANNYTWNDEYCFKRLNFICV